jgi:hypothetical protein
MDKFTQTWQYCEDIGKLAFNKAYFPNVYGGPGRVNAFGKIIKI